MIFDDDYHNSMSESQKQELKAYNAEQERKRLEEKNRARLERGVAVFNDHKDRNNIKAISQMMSDLGIVCIEYADGLKIRKG